MLFGHLLTRNFKRSLPTPESLQDIPNVARLLRNVLMNGWSADKLDETPALNFCYKMGWLQAELVDREELNPEKVATFQKKAVLGELLPKRTVYVFPTRIHQRCDLFDVYYHCRECYSKIFRMSAARCSTRIPSEDYRSVKDLCISVIRKILPCFANLCWTRHWCWCIDTTQWMLNTGMSFNGLALFSSAMYISLQNGRENHWAARLTFNLNAKDGQSIVSGMEVNFQNILRGSMPEANTTNG
jgi:hypothetical protein